MARGRSLCLADSSVCEQEARDGSGPGAGSAPGRDIAAVHTFGRVHVDRLPPGLRFSSKQDHAPVVLSVIGPRVPRRQTNTPPPLPGPPPPHAPHTPRHAAVPRASTRGPRPRLAHAPPHQRSTVQRNGRTGHRGGLLPAGVGHELQLPSIAGLQPRWAPRRGLIGGIWRRPRPMLCWRWRCGSVSRLRVVASPDEGALFMLGVSRGEGVRGVRRGFFVRLFTVAHG